MDFPKAIPMVINLHYIHRHFKANIDLSLGPAADVTFKTPEFWSSSLASHLPARNTKTAAVLCE